MSDQRANRADARQHWPGRLSDLGQPAADDLSGVTTVEQRLAMMWELAVRAWKLSGRPLPDYARSDMPGTVLRPPR